MPWKSTKNYSWFYYSNRQYTCSWFNTWHCSSVLCLPKVMSWEAWKPSHFPQCTVWVWRAAPVLTTVQKYQMLPFYLETSTDFTTPKPENIYILFIYTTKVFLVYLRWLFHDHDSQLFSIWHTFQRKRKPLWMVSKTIARLRTGC